MINRDSKGGGVRDIIREDFGSVCPAMMTIMMINSRNVELSDNKIK